MFKMQWKLIFQKKAVWLAFLISLVHAIYAFIYEKMNPMVQNMAGFWHYCGLGDSSAWSRFIVILSFLIAIPAMSFQWDVSDNTIAAICVRENRKEYLKAKMNAVFWTEFLIVVIPFSLNLLLCMLFFNHTCSLIPSPYGSAVGFSSDSSWAVGTDVLFPSFFINYPIIYLMVFLIFLGGFVGLLGLALLALSFWFRRIKLLLFVPVFALTQLGGNILFIWSYYTYHMQKGHLFINFNMWDYVSPMSYVGKVYPAFGVFMLILVGFIYWSYRMMCRKEFIDV